MSRSWRLVVEVSAKSMGKRECRCRHGVPTSGSRSHRGLSSWTANGSRTGAFHIYHHCYDTPGVAAGTSVTHVTRWKSMNHFFRPGKHTSRRRVSGYLSVHFSERQRNFSKPHFRVTTLRHTKTQWVCRQADGCWSCRKLAKTAVKDGKLKEENYTGKGASQTHLWNFVYFLKSLYRKRPIFPTFYHSIG